jgi:hypothetical protein
MNRAIKGAPRVYCNVFLIVVLVCNIGACTCIYLHSSKYDLVLIHLMQLRNQSGSNSKYIMKNQLYSSVTDDHPMAPLKAYITI